MVEIKKSLVSVVIPIYKEFDQLSKFEMLSLSQCRKIMSSYTYRIFCPENISTLNYKLFFEGLDIDFEYFNNSYFQSVNGYNTLMLSEIFYQRFIEFEYILLYQLDAMVFDDQLKVWCSKGYDYIGAPWLTQKFNTNFILSKYKIWKSRKSYKKNLKYKKNNLPLKEQFYNKVGNGGFSLRRTQKMLDILIEMPDVVNYYLAHSTHSYYHEDAFWGLEVNRNKQRLWIPDYQIAVFFSIEFKPELAFELTGGKYPFGCHDWDANLAFWRGKFLELGIDLDHE